VADGDLLKRSLDMGMAVTQLTRERAERIVAEFVKAGELSQRQAAKRVEDLVRRSRQNVEVLRSLVRKEIDARLGALNVVTRDQLPTLLSRLGIRLGRAAPAAVKKAPAKRAPAGAKKVGAKKTTAKKAAAKKTSARKA